MSQTVIDKAKNVVSKVKSLEKKYIRDLKKEVYSLTQNQPKKVYYFPPYEYKKFWENYLVKFENVNKEYFNSNSLQEKVDKLKIMVKICGEVFAKKAKWETYSAYKTEFVSMVQLIDNITKELLSNLEAEAKKVKDGNIDKLNF